MRKDEQLVRLRIANRAGTRDLSVLFPNSPFETQTKHNHYRDFGFPTTLNFKLLHNMFRRNGLARAAVNKTVDKTWETSPFLLEQERDGSQTIKREETPLEKQIRLAFKRLRFWTKVSDADSNSLVSGYAGLILRFADNRPLHEPVESVPNGIDGLVEVIPVWSDQLTALEWDQNELSQTFGKVVLYEFKEAAVKRRTGSNPGRTLKIHPSRIIIWSDDGTTDCYSMLEAGYNDLVTVEKIVGASGEGFWKNAKSSPIFEMDPKVDVGQLEKTMGMKGQELIDSLNAQVEAYQRGFDEMMLVQGITAKQLNVSLSDPASPFSIAVQSFSASISMPMKILIGMQTGERASTEDAQEWARTIMARRAKYTEPNIMLIVERLVEVGCLEDKDWYIDWDDLTEASSEVKFNIATKMAEINAKTIDSMREIVFTPDEIRGAVDREPLADGDKFLPEETEPEVEDPEAEPGAEDEQ